MNKVFVGMVVAVCVLGMILLMLNERVARKPEAPAPAAENAIEMAEASQPAQVSGGIGRQPDEEKIESLERAQAEAALAPPVPAREEQARPAPVKEPEKSVAEAPSRLDPVPQPAPFPPRELPTPVSRQPMENPPVEVPPAAPETPAPQPPQSRPVPLQPAQAAPQHQAQTRPVQTQPAPARPQAPKTAQAPANRTITNFVLFARDKGATVRFSGNSPINYKSMLLENPDRVVLDFAGNWDFPKNLAFPKNELVENVRVGKVEDRTRVVIDLKEKPRVFRLVPGKNGDSIDVRLDK